MNPRTIERKLTDDEGLMDALNNHDGFAKHSFGGVWKGIIYAGIVAWGIALVGATGGTYMLPVLTSMWLGVLFNLLTKYDSTCVALWNQREYEEVVTKYTLENLDTILQDVDFEGNLDGTNGDE